MNRHKKLLAVLTLACFLFTLMPIAAFAEITSNTNPISAEKSYVEIPDEIYTMDIVRFKVKFCDQNGMETTTKGNIYFWLTTDKQETVQWGISLPVHYENVNSIMNPDKTEVLYFALTEIDKDEDVSLYIHNPGQYTIHYSFTEPVIENGDKIVSNADNYETILVKEKHSCGDNATWEFDSSTATLTISGTGAITDDGNWNHFDDVIRNIVITDGITEISEFAYFRNYPALESISFPESMERLNEGILFSCEKLKEITVDSSNQNYYVIDNVLYQNNGNNDTLLVYAGAKQDEQLVVPDGVSTIAREAFSDNMYLKKISIPEKVIDIEEDFLFCRKLESIEVSPDNAVYFDDNGVLYKQTDDALELVCYPENKEATSYTVLNGVKEIKRDQFRFRKNLQTIILPETLKSIGYSAFESCKQLKSINIPDGVTEIGGGAFSRCTSLQTVSLPKSLKYLGTTEAEFDGPDIIDVFVKCTSLTDVYYAGSEAEWDKIIKGYTDDDDVNVSLQDVNIHFNTTITNNPVSPEKSYVELPAEAYILDGKYEGVPFEVYFCDEDGNLTSSQGNIYFWMADNNPAKYGWSKHGAGKGDSLIDYDLNATIYSGVKEADNNSKIYISFYEPGVYEICYSFTKPIVENGTTIVSEPDGSAVVKVIDNPNCGDNATWTLSEDGVLTISGTGKVSYGPWEYYLSDVTKIVVEEGITELGVVFHSAAKLKSIELPASLGMVGEGFIWFCDNLKTIGVAQGNTALSVIDNALYQKVSSGNVLITYAGGSNTENVIIPNGVTRIGINAFESNRYITSITLPETIESLGNSCFGWCYELKQIYIPDSVNELGYYMFEYSDKLTDIYYGGTEEQWNALNAEEKWNEYDGITVHFNSTGISSDSTTDNNTSSGSTGSGGGSSYTPSTSQSSDDITINNTNSNISVETSEVKASVIGDAKQAVSKDNDTEIIGGVDCAVNISAEDKQGNDVNAFFTPLTVEIPLDRDVLRTVDNISHLTLAKVITDANGNTSLVYMGGNYDTQSGLFTVYVDEPGDYVLVEDADVKKIELQIGNHTTGVNGTDKTSDVAPCIIDNHTYVPLRYIAEILGCDVAWDEATRTVTITQNGITMKLVIDETISGYGVSAVIRENRTLVPLRYIAEQLGANVIWHPETQEIVIAK